MLLRYLASLGPVFLVAAASAQGAGGDGEVTARTGESGASLLEDFTPGSTSLAFRLGFFDQPDNGSGNPFLDEDLTVIEPVVIYDHDVSDDFGYGFQLSYDYVSSASIERLSNFPEQSGASADNYVGLDVHLRHRLPSGKRLGWHVGASTEYDYTSIGAGSSLAWQPAGADATVTFSLDGFYDMVDVIRFDGSGEGEDTRLSLTLSGNWYQILSPRTHGEFGASLAQQAGFLETPYNAVVREDDELDPNPNLANHARGEELTEELPDSRTRLAVYGRVRTRTTPGRAWELGSRLYSDTWGISSIALEPRMYQTLVPESLDLRLRYRYYVQTASKYFEEHFTQADASMVPGNRTQDSDLGDFNTHLLGARLQWYRTARHTLDFGMDYVLRSDGLDYVFGSLGWTWSN